MTHSKKRLPSGDPQVLDRITVVCPRGSAAETSRWARRSQLGLFAFLALIVGIVIQPFAFAIAVGAGGQHRRAFGFEVGEERRYALGPPEALERGESAAWQMRLDRVRDNGEAVFALEHERTSPQPTSSAPAYGQELSAQMKAELSVNVHGFPMAMWLEVHRSVYGYPDDRFYVRYTFDGRSLQKHVDTFGKQWDIAVPISGHRNLDKSVPIGLYAFLPDAFHCVGHRSAVARVQAPKPPQSTAGSGLSPPGALPRVDRYELPCEPNTDLGFLNPGLLSLAWPAVIEAGGEEDFLFFTPTGADLFPGPRVSGNVGGIGGNSTGGGGIDRARDPRRYYTHSNIELTDHTQLRLRGRSFEAVVARIDGLSGVAYVMEEGKVLLIDIDRTGPLETMVSDVVRRGIVNVDVDGFGQRHIRLLFPSEY